MSKTLGRAIAEVVLEGGVVAEGMAECEGIEAGGVTVLFHREPRGGAERRCRVHPHKHAHDGSVEGEREREQPHENEHRRDHHECDSREKCARIGEEAATRPPAIAPQNSNALTPRTKPLALGVWQTSRSP